MTKRIETLALILMGAISCAPAQTPGTFTATGNMTSGRAYPTACLLPDGRVSIAAGSAGEVPAVGPEYSQVGGGKFAEILYFGEAPGYPGYYQVNFRMPSGVAPGPVPVRLTHIGRSTNQVTVGVR